MSKLEEQRALRDERDRVCKGIAPAYWPTPAQFRAWKDWILWGDGVDSEGKLHGFCPLHDPDRQTESSAVFSFTTGAMWCSSFEAEDGSITTCHPGKRAMSLVNVKKRLSDGANAGQV